MKKSNGKRCLALLLCVMLLCSLTVIPAYAEEAVGDHEHVWVEKSTYEGYNCQLGNCWMFYKECTICGAQQQIAFREYDGLNLGQHDFVQTTRDSGCPYNPTIEKRCSICHQTEIVEGGHDWGPYIPSGDSSCTSVQVSECSYCGATQTKGATGHSWRLVKTTPATCTQPATEEQECNTCHTTRTVEKSPALGHNFGGLTDCTVARQCVRCNETKPAGSHSWGAYVATAQGHYQSCTLCDQTTDMAGHTDNGAGWCSVCGYKMRADAAPTPSGCSHEWTITKRFGAFDHTEKCSKCGETRNVSCTVSGTRTDCTQPLYCACGNKVQDGNPRHYLGAWIKTASGHERHCTSAGCTYSESGAHTMEASGSCTAPTACTACGYASGTGAYSDHAWGAWVNSGSGSHSRSCTHPGCTAKQSAAHSAGSSNGNCKTAITCTDCGAVVVAGSSDHAWGHWISSGGSHYRSCTHAGCSAKQTGSHSGGTATCASGARCADCGAEYGAKNPANHSGGTEIRNAKAATKDAPGYTGDTYCLGCGQKLADGQDIPVLTDDHTHSYGAWVSDSTGHWHECECGDIKDNTAHTFKDGKCTVCGAADPNAKTEHVHTYTESWNADSQNHWHVCTVCGEKADVTAHVIVTEPDGSQRCIDCGLTLKEKVEKENTEAAVEQFSDVKEDSFYASSVGWAVKNKITQGTGGKSFSPTQKCTVAEILTMLYRAAGSPAISGPAMDGWGDDMGAALTWASETGLLDENFDPRAICTRSSAVTYMWKAAGSPAAGSASFSDVDAGNQAIAWAVEKGITNGTNTEANTFSPNLECDRSQIVTLLYREAN